MVQIMIENMVAAAEIGKNIDMESVAKALDSEKSAGFPGVIYNNRHPKAACIIFQEGLLVLTGPKNLEDVTSVVKTIITKLRSKGIEVKTKTQVKVKNIVASYDFWKRIDLDEVIELLPEDKARYEPDVFPGVEYQMESGFTALIFESGKIVFTGANKLKDIENACDDLIMKLGGVELSASDS